MRSRTKFLGYISIVTLICISLTFILMNFNNFIIISSPSMVPTLHVGDIVYFDDSNGNYDVGTDNGDIIIIKGPGYYYENGIDPYLWNNIGLETPIIHRAISRHYNESENMYYFETKGDNNVFSDGCLRGIYENGFGNFIVNVSDPILIPESEIIGKVVFVIPLIGIFGMYFDIVLYISIAMLIIQITLDFFKIKIKFKITRKLSNDGNGKKLE